MGAERMRSLVKQMSDPKAVAASPAMAESAGKKKYGASRVRKG
jgi:hypothetical protein